MNIMNREAKEGIKRVFALHHVSFLSPKYFPYSLIPYNLSLDGRGMKRACPVLLHGERDKRNRGRYKYQNESRLFTIIRMPKSADFSLKSKKIFFIRMFPQRIKLIKRKTLPPALSNI